jgi:hypothetical protein
METHKVKKLLLAITIFIVSFTNRAVEHTAERKTLIKGLIDDDMTALYNYEHIKATISFSSFIINSGDGSDEFFRKTAKIFEAATLVLDYQLMAMYPKILGNIAKTYKGSQGISEFNVMYG